MSTLTDARDYVGGLSKPSKMPGMAYSIPAENCLVGSKLRSITGSVCSECYACKGRYVFSNVQNALQRRLSTIDKPDWAASMAIAINNQPWFRWHDSGDIQSLKHLEKIAHVTRLTPNTRHWIPTREKQIVRAYMRKHGAFPENLTIRLSATMIDGKPPKFPTATSTVHKTSKPIGHRCPAPSQKNKCNDCRACWDKTIENIAYHAH